MNQFVTNLNQEWLTHVKNFKKRAESSYKALKNDSNVTEKQLEEIRENYIGPLQVKYMDLTNTYSQNFDKYYRMSDKIKQLVNRGVDLKNPDVKNSLQGPERDQVEKYLRDVSIINESKNKIERLSESVDVDLDYFIFKQKMVSVHAENQSLYVGNQREDPLFGNIRDGYGYLSESNNQKIYFGSWKDGMRHGYGKQIYENGTLFMGSWENDKPELGFLRIGISKELYYGAISDGIVCTRELTMENSELTEMLIEDLGRNEYEVINPEGFSRTIESYVKLKPFLSVKGLHAKSTGSIHYDSGSFLLENVEANPSFKMMHQIILKAEEKRKDEAPSILIMMAPQIQSTIHEFKVDFISLYNRCIPHMDYGIFSKFQHFGKRNKSLRLLKLFNGTTLICVTKFDTTLKTNIFSGPVCIVTEGGDVFNRVIKTKILSKATKMNFTQGGALSIANDQFEVNNRVFEAEIFPMVFRPTDVDDADITDFMFVLETITGKESWDNLSEFRKELGFPPISGTQIRREDGEMKTYYGQFKENFALPAGPDNDSLKYEKDFNIFSEIIDKYLINRNEQFQQILLENEVINPDLTFDKILLAKSQNQRFTKDPFTPQIVQELIGERATDFTKMAVMRRGVSKESVLSTKTGIEGFDFEKSNRIFKVESSKNGMLEITRVLPKDKEVPIYEMDSYTFMTYTNFEILNGLKESNNNSEEEYSTHSGAMVNIEELFEINKMIKKACQNRFDDKIFREEFVMKSNKTIKIYNDLFYSDHFKFLRNEIQSKKDESLIDKMLQEYENVLILMAKLLTPIPLLYSKKKRLIGDELTDTEEKFTKYDIKYLFHTSHMTEWNNRNKGKNINYLDFNYTIDVDGIPLTIIEFYNKFKDTWHKFNEQKYTIAEKIHEKVVDIIGVDLKFTYSNGDTFDGYVYNIGNIYTDFGIYKYQILSNEFKTYCYQGPIRHGLFFGSGEVVTTVSESGESDKDIYSTIFYYGYPLIFRNTEEEKLVRLFLENGNLDQLSNLGEFGKMLLTDYRLIFAYVLTLKEYSVEITNEFLVEISKNMKMFESVINDSREDIVNKLERNILEEARLIHHNEDEFEYYDQVEDIIILEDAGKKKDKSDLKKFKSAMGNVAVNMLAAPKNDDVDRRLRTLDNNYNDNERLLDPAVVELPVLRSSRKVKVKSYSFKHKWIEKLDIERLSDFEKYKIVQVVEDNDLEAMKDIYEKFNEKDMDLDLLEIEDKFGKNLLMISMLNGYRQCTIDILAMLHRIAYSANYDPGHSTSGLVFCLESDAKVIRRIENIILKRDNDGNNCIDLACIQGYLHEDSLFFCEGLDTDIEIMKTRASPHVQFYGEIIEFVKDFKRDHKIDDYDASDDIPTINLLRKSLEFRFDFATKLPGDRKVMRVSYDPRSGINANGPQGRVADLDSMIQTELVRDPELYKRPRLRYEIEYDILEQNRELFTTRFYRTKKLEKHLEKLKKAKFNTSDTYFMTRRSVCLQAMFRFLRIYDKVTKTSGSRCLSKRILKEEDYHLKKNNPLHFTLHHADLHSTIELLKNQSTMIFWQNGLGKTPPEDISNAGDNKIKAQAILSSILNEEIRLFNNVFMREFLLENERIFRGVDPIQIERFKNRLGEERINTFNPYFVDLYKNDYILLHDELCLGYMNNSQRLSRVQRGSDNISELEAMQRNFTDFHTKYDLDRDYARKWKESVILHKRAKKLIYWCTLVHVEPEIIPEALILLNIDPFERLIDGRNLVHLLCVSGSHETLKSILEVIYADSYRDRGEEGRQEFRIKMKESTSGDMNSPAHLCLINMKIPGCLLCLSVLKEFGIDIDKPNIRGRTVRELLDLVDPFILPSSSNVVKKAAIAQEIFEFMKFYIMKTCEYESFKSKYKVTDYDIGDAVSKPDIQLIGRHFYPFRKEIVKGWEDYNSTQNELREHLEETKVKFMTFQSLNLEKENLIKLLKKLNIVELTKRLEKAKSNPKQAGEIPEINRLISISKELTPFIRISMDLENDNLISMQSLMMGYFNVGFCLNFIDSSGMNKYEKMRQIEFFDYINNTCDFSQPLGNELDDLYTIDPILCIEILYKVPEGQEHLDETFLSFHPVLDQLRNIQRKYYTFGGGIKLEALKGREFKKSSKMSLPLFFCSPKVANPVCKDKYESWFILISVSDKLLLKKAEELQLLTYNMKDKYHTVYYKGGYETGNLEPLRHSQKMKIIMNILDDEFDIEKFQKEGLLESFFPVHDYKQMNAIKNLWYRYFYNIHIESAFGKSKKKFLRFMSYLNLYHGTDQAFFFAFLAYYNNSILFLAILSLVVMISLVFFPWMRDIFALVGPFFIGIWSTILTNAWERREEELNYVFGNQADEDEVKKQRSDFQAPVIIDEATQTIRKYKNSYFSKISNFLLTGILLVVRFIVAYLIYNQNAKLLNTKWEDKWSINPKDFPFVKGRLDMDLEMKPILAKGIEPVVTLISNYFFAFIVSIMINYENNEYNEDYRNSFISKTVPFDVFAALFTPVVNSFKAEKQAGLWSSILINLFFTVVTYSLNMVVVPLFTYATSRYYFLNYGCCCKCCWCKGENGFGPGSWCRKKGKIEDFKEEIVVKMYDDKKTCFTFTKYCLGESELFEYGKNENIKKLRNKIRRRELGWKALCSPSGGNDEADCFFSNDMMEVMNASKQHDSARREILRKQYANFVMTKAQIHETALQKSLSSQETKFYTFVLIQFTWICLFSPIVFPTPLLSFVLNYLAIWLTIVMYSELTQRPITRTETSMKVWNDMYKIIGYIGIIYNAVYLIKVYDLKPLRSLYQRYTDDGKGTEEGYTNWKIYAIFWLENSLLIVKFIIGLGIKMKSPWLKKRLTREKEMQKKVNTLMTNALTKFVDEKLSSVKENPNVDMPTDPRYFIDSESEGLRLFFKDNRKQVKLGEIVVAKEF